MRFLMLIILTLQPTGGLSLRSSLMQVVSNHFYRVQSFKFTSMVKSPFKVRISNTKPDRVSAELVRRRLNIFG